MQVLITYRLTWQRNTEQGGDCSSSTVAAATLLNASGHLVCREGCVGMAALKYQCTDFSVDDNWSTGQGSNEMNFTGVTNFEAS